MPTGVELREDQSWVESQGYQLSVLDQDRAREDWYRPDGKRIPGLPVDAWNRAHYRAKGWSLKAPTPEEITAWKQANPQAWAAMQPALQTVGQLPVELAKELAEVTGTALPKPPRHMHVYQDAIGSPCLVLGCGALRKQIKGNNQAKKQAKEASHGRNG